MKFRHVSALYPFVVVTLIALGYASYIGMSKLMIFCFQHQLLAKIVVIALSGLLAYRIAAQAKPEDFSQEKYPSRPNVW